MTADEMLAFRRLKERWRKANAACVHRCGQLEDDIERLRFLLTRSRDLAKYAVDIPSRELEAQQFLADVDEELNA